MAQLLGWEISDDGTADGDRPRRGRSMPAMRRPRVVLPAPDGPDHGQVFAGADVEVDAVQHVGVVVGVVDVGDHDVLIERVLVVWWSARGSGMARPSMRANEARLLWRVSTQISMVSIGEPSCRR